MTMNRQFDWKHFKKTDWMVLGIIGVLLLVIMLPEENGGERVTSRSNNGSAEAGSVESEISGVSEKNDAEKYVSYLEEKLEEVLREMDGVGKVKVMITLSDYGEAIVEKDTVDMTNTVDETDSSGGSRNSYEHEVQAETVRVESDSGSYPYVGKEILPTIEGVVVVAEGGGNAMVVSQISKAAMALFPIEAHKIIVVKMSQGG